MFKLILVALVISLVLFFTLFSKNLFQTKIADSVLNFYPQQSITTLQPFDHEYAGYKYHITPVASYEIYGLVVSYFNYNSWLNTTHKNDPGNIRDICLVFGKNIKNNSYKNVEFTSEEFFCQAKITDQWTHDNFALTSFSNNHLLSANKQIEQKIMRTNKNDQVHIKGYLINYSVLDDNLAGKGMTPGSRDTSTILGKGKCQIIYVTDFDIISQ